MLHFCSKKEILIVHKPVGTTSPPEPASKRSKVTTQLEKVIPTKHYLEPSAGQQGLFLPPNCFLIPCLFFNLTMFPCLSSLLAPKRAKITRKLRLETASSDEETKTDTEALVSISKLSSYSEKSCL